jgi:hypothetical protein
MAAGSIGSDAFVIESLIVNWIEVKERQFLKLAHDHAKVMQPVSARFQNKESSESLK